MQALPPLAVDLQGPAVQAFVVLPFLLLVALVCATVVAWRRSGSSRVATGLAACAAGIGALGWMAGTWLLAARGTFLEWDRTPPPFGLLVVAITIVSCAIAFSALGTKLARYIPLWVLVAVQAFRLPLELAMHAMYERGVMPREMSYSGRNFDILTGAAAIVAAALTATNRAGIRLVAVWNIAGFALLINVIIVAILGTPRFRFFGEDSLNTWVALVPFVWLPAVMVVAALAGHLIIFRALGMQRGTREL
jgi:hypothetical protein